MRRRSLLLSSGLLIAACASDATFVRSGGAAPDPEKFEADASDCRSFWPMVGGFFIGAAYGAAEGAIVGASSGGADIGAIIGAGAGGVIGLTIGAVASADGESYDRCMLGRGYVQAGTDTVRPSAITQPPETLASAPPEPAPDEPQR